MRIIGTTERERYLVEVTKEELGKLSSFGSRYAQGFPNELKVGTELEINDVLQDATEALNGWKEAAKAANNLKASATRFLKFFEVREEREKP